MQASKVIKCVIINPTKTKLTLLQAEYANVQHFLKTGEDRGCYSTYKADLLWRKPNTGYRNEQPLPLRHSRLKIDYSKGFIRIPVRGRRGGVWLPFKAHELLLSSYRIHDSLLVRKKDGNFQVNLVVSKEVEIDYSSLSSLTAIDIGERVLATAVPSGDSSIPRFYGREVRGVRRHHAWLRKRLGEKKLLKKIKEQGNREHRQVDAILHKISKAIVGEACKSHSAIAIGNVKGIRHRQNKRERGKRFNRILNVWPYDKLCQMIEYKATWQGIPVIYVNEDCTSQECSNCGSTGKRPHQGLFMCPTCRYRVNADYNGARNILKRTSEYISEVGATSSLPLTMPMSMEAGLRN